jgi:hypothetical protein
VAQISHFDCRWLSRSPSFNDPLADQKHSGPTLNSNMPYGAKATGSSCEGLAACGQRDQTDGNFLLPPPLPVAFAGSHTTHVAPAASRQESKQAKQGQPASSTPLAPASSPRQQQAPAPSSTTNVPQTGIRRGWSRRARGPGGVSRAWLVCALSLFTHTHPSTLVSLALPSCQGAWAGSEKSKDSRKIRKRAG